MLYQSVREGLNSKSTLIPVTTNISEVIKNPNKDYYVSLYNYTEEHKKVVDATGKVAGIRDTTTDKLVFDFDSVDNLDQAKQDTINVALSLIQDYNFNQDSLSVFYSGKKGFTLEAKLDSRINPETFKNAVLTIAGNYSTFDKVVNDPNRIIRVPNTKHQDSGLFKIPLYLHELEDMSIKDIQALAKTTRHIEQQVLVSTLPQALIKLPKPERVVKEINTSIDFTKKASFLTNCRYALQNGLFENGNRSNVLICLAATYKNQGFDIEHTYRFLKGVCELQARYTNSDRFPDNELYNNVCLQVYSATWNGGQYSCRIDGWLKTYCESLGHNKCKHGENATASIEDTFNTFQDYALHHEENILYTGIDSLDENMKFMVGTTNALVGPPGIGKTAISMQILNHNSSQNIPSLFFSYDMFSSALYIRMIQRHTGLHQDKIYEMVKKNPAKMQEIKELLKKEYANVRFCFKAGQTIDELENTILETEDKLGKKLKLVVVDYNELVSTNTSDATASSAIVAQRLRQIANERKVCIITLLQPSKLYTSPSDEITSYSSAKGSSAIAQAQTLMLGMSRPGFNPLDPSTDKFFNVTCLKNRNGALFSVDLSWTGLTGRIGELDDNQMMELRAIRDKKALQKSEDKSW